ncbi:hypothetical protein GGI23_007699, partial [Coemansia sp. RSA 2559]
MSGADAALRTLNSPRLFEQAPLDDALDDALQTYVSAETRPRRDSPSDSEHRQAHSAERLNQYVTGGQWRALALAASATIQATAANEEHTLLNLWVYRILALLMLQQQGGAQVAEREVAKLEHATQYASVARSGGKSPTIAWPFELRLLRARIPGAAHDDWAESAARLCALLRGCRRVLPSAVGERAMRYTRRVFRVSLMITTCAMRLGDCALAVQMLDRLLVGSDDPRLISAVARTYLQLGAVPAAERLFISVEKLAAGDAIVLVNRAMFAVATGKWDVARDLFARVFADHPDRIAVGNNAAICDLYLGNPQAMLSALQHLM